MKLSKVTFIFLIVGVLIIVGASLGMAHSRQSEQQKQLEQQINAAKQKLSSIDNSEILANQDQLEKEKNSYDSQLESIRNKLNSDEDSISATEELLNAAADFDVEVVTLDSPGQSSEELVSTTCDVLSLNIQVDGDLLGVKQYINNLSLVFPTSIVKNVQLSSASSQNTDVSVPGYSSEPTASAKVNLVIYDYEVK